MTKMEIQASSTQGMQSADKDSSVWSSLFCCVCKRRHWSLSRERMPKLQRLKLVLPARCQFKYGEGGLKHMAVDIYCGDAVADEVEALEDDIRGAAAVHPNRPTLQVERIYQGLIIITTTRKKVVANKCCTGIAPQMYEAKPLSDEDSQRLFFTRLFSSSDDCHPDLRKVSDDILKKCCGLPLAIISIAGLLANRSKTVEVWVNVLRSIPAAVDKDSPIDKMKRILLLSYFDLPHHLKSCLLYLSVFPEDSLIDCRQLILLWVAEGLIPGQDRETMEQLGRSYLNELINRSLVQPTKVGADGATVKQCRVHVLVEKHASEFLNSQVLRVLNIESHVVGCNLGHVKSFGQLKHLWAGHQFIGVTKLPEDIEKLQHLETLDLRGARLENLPASIMLLQKLVRLFVRHSVHLPDEIRNLQALEELSMINLGIQSVEFIQGLGDLTYLKVLEIDWPCSTELRDMKDHKKACISTLSRLFRHLRQLRMRGSGPDATCSFMASCVPTPSPLQMLRLGTHNLNRVGPQISSLVNLSRLRIDVYGEAGKEGINILASLPMLLSLTVILFSDGDGDSSILYARHAISRQGFQRLVKFNFCCWREAALEFEPGAMPKLQRLKLQLLAWCQFKYGEGGLVLGLQNLGLGLKHVAVDIYCSAAVADEVEALEDDIRGATAVHPNRSSYYRLIEKYRCPAVETNFANFGDFRIFSVKNLPELTLKK
ncbi:unnamed protein product [Miscanthus lutarioriparius]|uniref:NB-ARC domain-containing protein n=1 Tax=Miscanthus lutarioriparius TaxID=422564 RepID=A0A811QMW3_9POAL|nr:unnamed protein product [Miscanthus lutarioriparius]